MMARGLMVLGYFLQLVCTVVDLCFEAHELHEYDDNVRGSHTGVFVLWSVAVFVTGVIAVSEFFLLCISCDEDSIEELNYWTKVKFMLQFFIEDFLLSIIKVYLFNNEVPTQLKSADKADVIVTMIVTTLQILLAICQLKGKFCDCNNNWMILGSGFFAVVSLAFRIPVFKPV